MFLGTRRVIVARREELLHAAATETADAGLESLQQWFEAQPGRFRVRLWLSGALCRVFVQDPVPGTRDSDLERIAKAEAPRRTGLIAPCVVWLEPRRRGLQRVAVALEAGVLDSVLQWSNATGRRMKLLAVRPWWSEVLCAIHDQQCECKVLVVDDLESLTVFSGGPGSLDTAVSIAPVSGGPEARSLQQRTLFGLGLDDAKPCTVMLAQVGAQLASRGDTVAVPLGTWVEQQ